MIIKEANSLGLISDNIELYMGPVELGAPDNLEKVIISFIDGSKKTLDIAVQELESKPIAEAIIAAKKRGVVINIVLEGDYLTLDESVDDPWTPSGENEMNREIHNALLRAKIDTHSDFNPHIFHQKFMIRDVERDDASLLTGSTNFTVTGTHSNFNHIVIFHSKKVAGVYQDEFDEIQSGTFGKMKERHDPAPKTYEVSDIPVKMIFAPDHTPELEIMKQMLKGKERIDFAIFTFSKSSGIDDTMVTLQKSGFKVRGVFDGWNVNQDWAAARLVAKAGCEVYSVPHKEGVNKLHHKLMVIDKQVVIAGSFNYTGPANALNDENIVVIGKLKKDPAEETTQLEKDIGAFALGEINRIIENYGQPIQ
ncbi:phosphatidylserine/phosphatidylglycerophosphate/cardiolipin synthase family protein [Thermoproteota archaeon]